MKIVVNTKNNANINTYYVGAGKKKLSLLPKSNITFTGEQAEEIFNDKGCLNAMKLNHTVLVSDEFVEEVKTPVEAPAEAPEKAPVSSAKAECELVKGCDTIEELEALELTNRTAKAQRTMKIKELKKK